MKKKWGILLIPAVFCGFLVGWWHARQVPRLQARQWWNQCRESSDQAVPEQIAHLATLGNTAIPYLVEGLNHDREVVVRHCHQKLTEMIREERDSSERRRTMAIVESLHRQVGSFRNFAKLDATELTLMILADMADGPEIRNPRILSLSEDIIDRTRTVYRLYRNPKKLNQIIEQSPGGVPQNLPSVTHGETLVNPSPSSDWGTEIIDRFSVDRAQRLFERYEREQRFATSLGFPSQTTHPPDFTASSVDEPRPASEGRDLSATESPPRTLPEMQFATMGTPRKSSPHIASPVASPPQQPHFGGSSPPKQPNLLSEKQMLEITPAILSDPPDPSRLSRSSPAELMRLLHHSNWRMAARAAGVLKRRDSFRTEHLRLAYDLFHPETARRKAVISHLSRLPNVNMVPWIMILMDDPEAEVRMAAIGYAATCQNSKIREIAARKAEADDHPDIRKMAAMIDRRAQ